MGSSFIAAVVLVVLWLRHSIRINIVDSYRLVFPVVLTMFLLMPFLPAQSIRWVAGVSYALNSIAILFMMVQCAQISRDRGINPVFIYGFFGGIMYALHDLGFIAGTLASRAIVDGVSSTAVVALIAVYILSLLFLVGQKRGDERAALFSDGNSIELVAGASASSQPKGSLISGENDASDGRIVDGSASGFDANQPVASAEASTAAQLNLDGPSANVRNSEMPTSEVLPKTSSASFGPSANAPEYVDRISKQVYLMKEDYGLSTREAEVAELLARGETVARIADMLFVSENTVRTHSKRIYAKLDIHKKQQLRDLVGSYDPSVVR